MKITWHGEETEDPVIMECDHCGKEISFSSLASQMYSYGAVFLLGKDHGFVGCICPSQPCSKSVLKKMDMIDYETVRLNLFPGEGPDGIDPCTSKVVYDSFPYDVEHPTGQEHEVGLYRTQLSDEFGVVELSEVDALLDNDSREDSPGRSKPLAVYSYHWGDPAMGPEVAIWWFPEDAIADRLRLENETQMKSFPRYIVHDPILSTIHSFCWNYRLVFDFYDGGWEGLPEVQFPGSAYKKAVEKNLEFLKILDTLRLADIDPRSHPSFRRSTIEGVTSGLQKPSKEQTKNNPEAQHFLRAFLHREKISDTVWEHFHRDHVQELLSMMAERFTSEYIEQSKTIHFSYESVWEMKEKYLKELYGAIRSRHKRHKARIRLLEEQRKEIAEIERQANAFREIVTDDPVLNEIKLDCFRGARNKMPDKVFLLIGETGTGKGLFAKAIHDASGRAKKGGAFVANDLKSITASLFESELFGHVKGAYTDADKEKEGLFEKADKGTIFLDEIGDISMDLQDKLRSPIQERVICRVGDANKERRVDVIIVLGTNRDLREEVTNGRFKEDLYYRIAGETFRIPPLRERKGDILHLVNHFIKKYSGKLQERELSSIGVSQDALELLESHNWPGNIRELENVVSSIVGKRSDPIDASEIRPQDFRDLIKPVSGAKKSRIGPGKGKKKLPDDAELIRLVDEEHLSKAAVGKLYGTSREQVSRTYSKAKKKANRTIPPTTDPS